MERFINQPNMSEYEFATLVRQLVNQMTYLEPVLNALASAEPPQHNPSMIPAALISKEASLKMLEAITQSKSSLEILCRGTNSPVEIATVNEAQGAAMYSRAERKAATMTYATNDAGESKSELPKYHSELLNKGVDVNEQNDRGQTALMSASMEGDLAKVALLLDHDGVNVELEDAVRETALIKAADFEYAKVVELLIAHGANVDHKNKYGATAMMNASRYGNLAMVELLLNNGADVNAQDNLGQTALMIASWKHERDLNKNVVELLLNKGADVNIQDNRGRTALMRAAMRGHPDLVGWILKRGANVNEQNDRGQTALMIAENRGHLDVVAILSCQNPTLVHTVS